MGFWVRFLVFARNGVENERRGGPVDGYNLNRMI